MMEEIICAAVHYDDGNEYVHQPTATGIVVGGWRHHNCLTTGNFLYINNDELKEETQGFLTSSGRFVDRHEAKEIAVAAGQVKVEHLHNAKILFSEDLY